jgi:hypothetical protein
MDTLPFPQKFIAACGHLNEQPPHIRPLDANAEHDFRSSLSAEQIDFRLSRPGDMDVRRFVVGRVNDEPEAMRAMDDNHGSI